MTQVSKTFFATSTSSARRPPCRLRSIAIQLVIWSAWDWRPQTFSIVVHVKRSVKNCIYIIWNHSQKGKNRPAKMSMRSAIPKSTTTGDDPHNFLEDSWTHWRNKQGESNRKAWIALGCLGQENKITNLSKLIMNSVGCNRSCNSFL